MQRIKAYFYVADCWAANVLFVSSQKAYSSVGSHLTVKPLWVCVCMNCEKGKKKSGHIPRGVRLRLISNALYERELSPRVRSSPSLLSLHLPPPLYSSFFFLPHISLTSTHPCSTLSCISFIWLSLRISSLNLAGFHFELLPKKLSRCVSVAFKSKKKNWNSGPEAKTGEDQSSPMNKITPEKSWTF